MPQTGTVALWLNHKGIGFITPDAGGDDYLVHFSEIQGDAEAFRSLGKGEKVEFELKADEKKEEGGEEKKKKKEKKKGEEKKEAPGKGKKKGKGEAVAPADEKRVDPEDGKACTWEEMFAKYKKTYVKENGRDALVEYWNTCKKAGKKAGGKGAKKGEVVASADEKRVDPEDGAACTWEEMFAKYKKTYVRENGRDALVEYWNTCKLAGKKKAGGKGGKKGRKAGA